MFLMYLLYLKAQLNEAKRRIIELEASDFQSSISSFTKVHFLFCKKYLCNLPLCLIVNENYCKSH